MSDENPHPSDWEFAGLADGTLGEPDVGQVREHIRSCMRCRDRFDRDRGPLGTDPDRFLSSLDRLVDRPAVAEWLHDALSDRQRPEPHPGQIWHVSGGGVAALALVHKVTGERAYVVPVTLETEFADEYTVVVDESHSPVESSLALWVRLATLVEYRTLAAHVVDSDLHHEVQAVRDDFVHGRPVESIRTGHHIDDILDPRWRYRDHLKVTFASLSVQPADAIVGSVEASSTAHSDAGDRLVQAVRAEIEYVAPWAHVVADPEADVMGAAVGSLRPALVVVFADLRIRVAVTSAVDDADLDGTAQDANLLGLLGDCDRLAIVHQDDGFPTRMLDPYDLSESFETPSGERRQARLVDPQPLDLTLGSLAQEHLAPHGMFDDVDLDEVDVDLSSVTGATALAALREQADRSWKGEKKDAFAALDEDDAALIATFVGNAAQRDAADYEREYDSVVTRSAA